VNEQVQSRLADLRREYELGQRRLQELVAEEVSIREALLRISGAIQVLTELTGQAAPAETAAAVPPSAASADAAGAAGAAQDAEAPAPGTVLRVG
jgi:hypothetical protein